METRGTFVGIDGKRYFINRGAMISRGGPKWNLMLYLDRIGERRTPAETRLLNSLIAECNDYSGENMEPKLLKHPDTKRTIQEEADRLALEIFIDVMAKQEEIAAAIRVAIERYAAPKYR